MRTKQVNRNIPPARENTNDRFRVKYGERSTFDELIVTIVRTATGEEQQYEFNAASLSEHDSIHFTTRVNNSNLAVTWDGAQPQRRIK
jgi:hypothetical protein